MQPTGSPNRYQPQMDGLRAVAVIAVLLHHFEGPFDTLLNFGTLGVRFFFVMSGFLITRLLLRARTRYESGDSSWQSEWSRFQMRRLVRTLPVYYLSLILAAALALPSVRESLVWTLSFLTNFYIAKLGYFPDTISHFWSLAVQEQFYFFWPFLIFFLPASWIKYSFAVLIALGVLFRFYCIQTGASEVVRWFSLPGSFDCFAIGGLLAYFAKTHPTLIPRGATRWWSGAFALGAVYLASQLRYLPLANPLTIWIELLEASAMGWVVACSVTGFGGWVGRLLSWGPLTYLGRISYGIYVYHILVAVLLHPVLAHYGLSGRNDLSDNVRFFSQLILTVSLSSLSWHYFEQPLLSVRERIGNWLAARPVLAAGKSCI